MATSRNKKNHRKGGRGLLAADRQVFGLAALNGAVTPSALTGWQMSNKKPADLWRTRVSGAL